MRLNRLVTSKGRTVVLFVDEVELVIDESGYVLCGVRAEVSELPPTEALEKAEPRPGELTMNSYCPAFVYTFTRVG